MKIFGREPTLWIAFITSAVLLIGTVGFRWLNADQAGLVVVAINALAGAANAYAVRPVSPAAFTYAAASLLALGAAYGFHVSPETSAALNGVVIMALGLLTRGQVSPQNTAISKASEATTKPEVQTVPEG